MAAQEEKGAKQPWRRPSLKYVGHVGDVLQAGGGKLTPSPADPGCVSLLEPCRSMFAGTRRTSVGST